MLEKFNSENSVVHESVDERQYVRVDMPVRVRIDMHGHSFSGIAEEISLGGFSVIIDTEHMSVGVTGRANIEIPIGSINLVINSDIEVMASIDGRVSCRYTSLNFEERDVLRYLISSYLAGEIVNVNGIFNVIQRESHVKKRKTPGILPRSNKLRFKAILGTLLFFTGALSVFSILVHKVYQHFYTVDSVQAYVATDTYDINMPANGYVSFILEPGTKRVETGQPIATVSTQLRSSLDMAEHLQSESDLSSEQLSDLFSRTTVETTLLSPCDCQLVWTTEKGDRFAYQDESLLKLLPDNSEMVIAATFEFKDLGIVKDADLATITMAVNNQQFTVPKGSVMTDQVNSLVSMEIPVEEQMDVDLLGTPVEVHLKPNLDISISRVREYLENLFNKQ